MSSAMYAGDGKIDSFLKLNDNLSVIFELKYG